MGYQGGRSISNSTGCVLMPYGRTNHGCSAYTDLFIVRTCQGLLDMLRHSAQELPLLYQPPWKDRTAEAGTTDWHPCGPG